MSFSALAALWDVVAPPLRPSAEDLLVYARQTRGRVLVLGATQELLDGAGDTVGVDICEAMVARASGHVVRGDWRALPFKDDSFDSVVGDGSLSAVGDHDDRRRVMREVRRVLRAEGRVVLRTYTRRESVASVAFDIHSIHSINALKLVLWGKVARMNGEVPLADVWRAFCALPEATRTAFPPEAAATLRVYRDSNDAYWVPTQDDLVMFVTESGFVVRSEHRSRSYELAERCPILTLEAS